MKIEDFKKFIFIVATLIALIACFMSANGKIEENLLICAGSIFLMYIIFVSFVAKDESYIENNKEYKLMAINNKGEIVLMRMEDEKFLTFLSQKKLFDKKIGVEDIKKIFTTRWKNGEIILVEKTQNI